MCCVSETIFAAAPARQCRVTDQVSATCNFLTAVNATAREGQCSVQVNKTTYFFDYVQVLNANCSCVNVTQNNRSGARCNCCLPRAMINATSLRAPGTCNATTASTQSCQCKNLNGTAYSCDCTRQQGNTQSKRSLPIDKVACSCLNSTTDGNNAGTCQCCVPNPPPTQCERLAENKPSNLRCKCAYVVIDGKADFRCDCNSVVNSTLTITKRDMPMNEAKDCCCIELSDPITRKGYKSCNCTQPPVFQTQNCQCKSVANARNSTRVNCDCTDCTRTSSKVTVPLGQCKCPASFYTAVNSTSMSNSSGKAENTTATNTTKTNSTTNATSSTNTTTNGTRTNTTTNATTSTNTTTNGTRTNTTTNTTSATNTTNATTNGTRTNTTTNATTSTNTTTNGTRTNTTTNTTSATNTTNATTNGTRTNTTNATVSTNQTASNATNGTRTNTTNGTVSSNTTTNGTRTNTTTNSTGTSNTT